MNKLYVATPAYDGRVTAAYANSLVQTFFACAVEGIVVVNQFKSGCCYVDLARNDLVHQFLKTDADTLLFIDADMGWDAKVVPRLYKCVSGVVGGAYPMKQDREQYPVNPLEQKTRDGYIEVQYLPTGFMMIKRAVFEHLIQSASLPVYRADGEDVRAFFRCVPNAEGYTGEDVEFCNAWRRIGGRVWCLPDINFEHHGLRTWSGNYADYLGRANVMSLAA